VHQELLFSVGAVVDQPVVKPAQENEVGDDRRPFVLAMPHMVGVQEHSCRASRESAAAISCLK
jgi:hypothetical protein